MISQSIFGVLADGVTVTMYTLTNSRGEYVELLDLGASLHSAFVRDREGRLGDVLLGVTEAEELSERSFEGTVIGRCGNRIALGRCVLDGKTVQLETNHRGNYLHGASGNYAFRSFRGTPLPEQNAVAFYLRDAGEGGFEDEVDVIVTYALDDESRLSIYYDMLPTATTVLSPTNHAYFNLLDFGDAREHMLTIYAQNVARKDDTGVPTGGVMSVKGTPLDFTAPRLIGDAMLSAPDYFPGGRVLFDDYYVLPGTGWRLAAELYAPKNGRILRTYTDMQCLVLFTPDNCARRRGKRDVAYPCYAGVCLETQFVPNAVNLPEFDSPVFSAGERLQTRTVYAFSTDADA